MQLQPIGLAPKKLELDSFTAQEFEKGLIAVQPQTDPFDVLVSQNSLFSIPITNILLEYVLYFNAPIKDIKILYHWVLLLDWFLKNGKFRFSETSPIIIFRG